MKLPTSFSVFLLLPFLLTTALAQELAQESAQENPTEKKQHLYIGIEENRMPYVDKNDERQAEGILVAEITRLCATINAECEFIAGEFNQLLQALQTYKLHTLLVIDTFILPTTDKLKLTPPLCKIQPVFIHKQDENSSTKAEKLKGTTIGVRQGSLLHLYLLEKYNHKARIKAFPLLESGIFDLDSGRIDSLSADQVFFSERLQKTSLGKGYSATPLKILASDNATLPATSMRLALREQNVELYESLTKAIKANGQPPYCSDLPGSQKQTEISTTPSLTDFDTPMPEAPLSGSVKPVVDKLTSKD